jgi:competence protein ComEA
MKGGPRDEHRLTAAETHFHQPTELIQKGDTMKKLIPIIVLVLMAVTTVAIAADSGPAGVVNVNTATADELQLLPRVGPALAGRILDFRDANGPFEGVEELVAVRGIGETSLEKLKPFVTVNGKTTLTQKVNLPRKSSQTTS